MSGIVQQALQRMAMQRKMREIGVFKCNSFIEVSIVTNSGRGHTSAKANKNQHKSGYTHNISVKRDVGKIREESLSGLQPWQSSETHTANARAYVIIFSFWLERLN